MGKKPTIAILTTPTNSGIIEGFLINFLPIMKPLTEKIYVMTDRLPETDGKHVKIIKVPSLKKRGTSLSNIVISAMDLIVCQVTMAYKLIRLPKAVDVVIFFVGTNILPLTILVAKILRKKTILYSGGTVGASASVIHNSATVSRLLILLETISFSLIDLIVIESSSILGACNLHKYRGKINCNGARYVDESFNVIKQISQRPKVVGYIGRISTRKGVDNFVDAIPEILSQIDEISFLIGGEGPLLQQIKDKISNSDYAEKVKMLGWIPQDEIVNYFSQIQLLVLPTYAEGLPTIVLESMACGTPVLATPVGGIPDIISDGVTGFIMESNTPECIAKNVVRAINSPDLEGIAVKAKEKICAEYSLNSAIKRYQRILESV